ncbi:hypothetical protein ALC56_07635 [Trachymyrmex septentrionalis]|uniref:Uncharacterized protein n=1 Tax=Trachymyrmex septentrionalis TaxID=34720 RepID=A0A195FC92_9HYME|nr:hypothetical protein ALC56_07635 [Trachymyrmex septentrionalis]
MEREEKVFRVSGIRTCIARRSSAGATTLNINKLNLLFPTRTVRREKPLNVTTSRQRGRKKSCCKGERRRKRRWCGSFRKIV